MAKDIDKKYRLPQGMCEYISLLAKAMNVSENDAIKMIIFNDMKNTRYSLLRNDK